MRKSVFFNIETIQCCVRQRQARKAKNKIIGLHKAFSKLQRIYRNRNAILNKHAIVITALFHIIHAKARSTHGM